MPYVSKDGSISDSQAFSVASISDYFWGFINFIVLFFRTLFQPSTSGRGPKYETDYRRPGSGSGGGGGGGGGGGRPQRRMGGFRGGDGGPSAPPMAGGG